MHHSMKRFLIILLVALLTLALMFIIYRPDITKSAWLWIVGLAGPVIGSVKAILKSSEKFFTKK